MFHFYILIVLSSIVTVPGWLRQSSISFTENATYSFQPAHDMELLQSLTLPSLLLCSAICVRLIDCRTLDYQASSKRCRLFQGSLDTGTIINGSSKIGSLPLESRFFTGLYNASCSACINNRYFICADERCQCPAQTFWNGSICRNQVYEGTTCNHDYECRNNLGLICTSARICTRSSFQTCPIMNTSTYLFSINRNTTSCTNNFCTQGLTINTSYFTLYCMSLMIAIQKTLNLFGVISLNHTFPSYLTNVTMWSNATHFMYGIRTNTGGFVFALNTYTVVIRLNVTSLRSSNNDTYEMIGLNGFNATYSTSNTF